MKLTTLIAQLQKALAESRTYNAAVDPEVIVVVGRCTELPNLDIALTLEGLSMTWEVELRVGEPE